VNHAGGSAGPEAAASCRVGEVQWRLVVGSTSLGEGPLAWKRRRAATCAETSAGIDTGPGGRRWSGAALEELEEERRAPASSGSRHAPSSEPTSGDE